MRQYRQSVARRLRLPCPHCGSPVRRPISAGRERGNSHVALNSSSPPSTEILCTKCQGRTVREGGHIQCAQCDWRRQWRAYRKEQKRRDEKLHCPSCACEFRWQTWKKRVSALNLGTGNARPAQSFVEAWPKCRTPEAKMLQIDLLVQAIHGRGELAGVFIEGNRQTIRQLLDELASQ